jgi:neutral ceramidase
MIKLAFFSLALSLFTTVQTNAQNTSFSAGFAKTNITPQWPVPMSGYGDRKGLSKGVHDSLYVRTTAFSDGQIRR